MDKYLASLTLSNPLATSAGSGSEWNLEVSTSSIDPNTVAFVETTTADFQTGTLTNVVAANNSLGLAMTSGASVNAASVSALPAFTSGSHLGSYSFTVKSPVQVYQLGYYNRFNSTTADVTISGSGITTTTIKVSGDSDGFYYKDITPVLLVPGVTYTITVGNATGSYRVSDPNPSFNTTYLTIGTTDYTNGLPTFKFYPQSYSSSGTRVSTFDISSVSPVKEILGVWNGTTPTGTTISFQISYDGGSTWNSMTNNSKLSALPTAEQTSVKVKSTLTTSNSSITPTLLDFTLNVAKEQTSVDVTLTSTEAFSIDCEEIVYGEYETFSSALFSLDVNSQSTFETNYQAQSFTEFILSLDNSISSEKSVYTETNVEVDCTQEISFEATAIASDSFSIKDSCEISKELFTQDSTEFSIGIEEELGRHYSANSETTFEMNSAGMIDAVDLNIGSSTPISIVPNASVGMSITYRENTFADFQSGTLTNVEAYNNTYADFLRLKMLSSAVLYPKPVEDFTDTNYLWDIKWGSWINVSSLARCSTVNGSQMLVRIDVPKYAISPSLKYNFKSESTRNKLIVGNGIVTPNNYGGTSGYWYCDSIELRAGMNNITFSWVSGATTSDNYSVDIDYLELTYSVPTFAMSGSRTKTIYISSLKKISTLTVDWTRASNDEGTVVVEVSDDGSTWYQVQDNQPITALNGSTANYLYLRESLSTTDSKITPYIDSVKVMVSDYKTISTSAVADYGVHTHVIQNATGLYPVKAELTQNVETDYRIFLIQTGEALLEIGTESSLGVWPAIESTESFQLDTNTNVEFQSTTSSNVDIDVNVDAHAIIDQHFNSEVDFSMSDNASLERWLATDGQVEFSLDNTQEIVGERNISSNEEIEIGLIGINIVDVNFASTIDMVIDTNTNSLLDHFCNDTQSFSMDTSSSIVKEMTTVSNEQMSLGWQPGKIRYDLDYLIDTEAQWNAYSYNSATTTDGNGNLQLGNTTSYSGVYKTMGDYSWHSYRWGMVDGFLTCTADIGQINATQTNLRIPAGSKNCTFKIVASMAIDDSYPEENLTVKVDGVVVDTIRVDGNVTKTYTVSSGTNNILLSFNKQSYVSDCYIQQFIVQYDEAVTVYETLGERRFDIKLPSYRLQNCSMVMDGTVPVGTDTVLQISTDGGSSWKDISTLNGVLGNNLTIKARVRLNRSTSNQVTPVINSVRIKMSNMVAVSSNQKGSYPVKAPLNKNAIPSYAIHRPISQGIAAGYKVKGQFRFNVPVLLDYSVRRTVKPVVNTDYSVRRTVQKLSNLVYAIRRTVKQKTNNEYAVRRTLKKLVKSSYGMRRTLWFKSGANYVIRRSVKTGLVGSYGVKGTTTLWINTKGGYGIHRTVERTGSAKYSVHRKVLAILNGEYKTRRTLKKSGKVEYAIKLPMLIKALAKYNVKVLISKELLGEYSIKQTTTIAVDSKFKYAIKNQLVLVIDGEYFVLNIDPRDGVMLVGTTEDEVQLSCMISSDEYLVGYINEDEELA